MDTVIKTEGCKTLEQGQAARTEAPTKTERDLGDPDSTTACLSSQELALFNLAIDSKLRGSDLLGLHVHDVTRGSRVASRAIVMLKKTEPPVVATWIARAYLKPEQFLFPTRVSESRTCRLGSILGIVGPSGLGWGRLAWTRRPTASILCGAPKLRRSSDRPGIAGLFSSFLGTQGSKAPSGISRSRWTMLWRSPSRPRCSLAWPADRRI
jgi:hypothetical protein